MQNGISALKEWQKLVIGLAALLVLIQVSGLWLVTIGEAFVSPDLLPFYRQIFCTYLWVGTGMVAAIPTYWLAIRSGRGRHSAMLYGVLVALVAPFAIITLAGFASEIWWKSRKSTLATAS